MTAWEAMTVASVARATMGISAQSGTSRKNGLLTADCWLTRSAPWPR
jgi:hypothetical protein